MHVASLELCKELYELSGRMWHEEIIYSWHKDDGDYVIEDFWSGSICPAYDLGYLLRKLPVITELKKWDDEYVAQCYWGNHDSHSSGIPLIKNFKSKANTPEDAACKLAIELFKQGILTK